MSPGMVSSGQKRGRRNLKSFGWQGINITVPEDWELVATGGDAESGYLRLADSHRVRLEARWEPARGSKKASEAVGRYLKRVRKKAKRQRTELSVRRHLGLASLRDKDIECYRWVSDQQALAMMSLCKECSRLVHVHVLGLPEEQLNNLARTIFSSLQDHSQGGALKWRFYDLEFCTPSGMKLQKQELKTGCVRMSFAGAGGELEFARMSVAQVVLAKSTLEEWFTGFWGKLLRQYRYTIGERDIKNHAGLEVAGVASVLRSPLRFIGRRRRLRAACWHCEETNSLFVCSRSSRSDDEERFREAVHDFRCCDGQGSKGGGSPAAAEMHA